MLFGMFFAGLFVDPQPFWFFRFLGRLCLAISAYRSGFGLRVGLRHLFARFLQLFSNGWLSGLCSVYCLGACSLLCGAGLWLFLLYALRYRRRRVY